VVLMIEYRSGNVLAYSNLPAPLTKSLLGGVDLRGRSLRTVGDFRRGARFSRLQRAIRLALIYVFVPKLVS